MMKSLVLLFAWGSRCSTNVSWYLDTGDATTHTSLNTSLNAMQTEVGALGKKKKKKHTHTRTHAHFKNTHTHTHKDAHKHEHTLMHTRKHTHTHSSQCE